MVQYRQALLSLLGSAMSEKTAIETLLHRYLRAEDVDAVIQELDNIELLDAVAAPHIVSTPGVAGGKPRIDGHRITVQNIAIWHDHMGMSVDEIASGYRLTLGQIHAALAYYYDHLSEIETSIRADEAFIEELKQRQPPIKRLMVNRLEFL
jgi:uncharacterized protein (DUF433 family)